MAPVKPFTNPLLWNAAIADTKTGYPTPAFIRAWEQTRTLTGLIPWSQASMSALLDLIGKTPGDILVRGVTVWNAVQVSGDATLGLDGTLTVTGIQGIPVTAAVPTDKQVLIYDAGTGTLVWATISGGGYSSFFIDGSGNYYVAVVNSVADPALVVDGMGVPVYVKNPAFTPNDPTSKPAMLARVFIGF